MRVMMEARKETQKEKLSEKIRMRVKIATVMERRQSSSMQKRAKESKRE